MNVKAWVSVENLWNGQQMVRFHVDNRVIESTIMPSYDKLESNDIRDLFNRDIVTIGEVSCNGLISRPKENQIFLVAA